MAKGFFSKWTKQALKSHGVDNMEKNILRLCEII